MRWGASKRCWLPLRSMLPQLGLGGGSPRPRKLRPASARMTPAIPTVAWTMTGPAMLGRRWRTRMRSELAPAARAESTNSSSRERRIWARDSLAYPTHPMRHSASTRFPSPGPRTATREMARRMFGKASRMSMPRITMSSSHPPQKPATVPTARPITAEQRTTTTLRNREMRAPYMSRLRMSRPSSSSPSGWSREGAAKRWARSWLEGAKGARNGATAATSPIRQSTAAPESANGSRLRWFPRERKASGDSAFSAKANPWIEEGVGEIGHHVHQDIGKGDDQYASLHERVVARLNRLDGEAAEAGPSEDGFGDHRPGPRASELQPEDGQHGNEGVLHRMAQDHLPATKATGGGGAAVRAGNFLQETGADHARQDGRQGGTESDRRQDQGRRLVHPRNGKPVQVHGEDENQQRADPEARKRQPEQRQGRSDPIPCGARVHGRQDSGGKRNQTCQQQARTGEQEGCRIALTDEFGHRLMVTKGSAQIPGSQP